LLPLGRGCILNMHTNWRPHRVKVHARAFCGALFSLVVLFSSGYAQSATGTALVRHAPSVNGSVEGSVQQMLAEGTIFNGGASVTQNLYVPGTPTILLNGSPNYGGTLEGTGAASPSNYQITLNGGATLSHVVRRTNAVSLPTVSAP
jgi:hypothetical protein